MVSVKAKGPHDEPRTCGVQERLPTDHVGVDASRPRTDPCLLKCRDDVVRGRRLMVGLQDLEDEVCKKLPLLGRWWAVFSVCLNVVNNHIIKIAQLNDVVRVRSEDAFASPKNAQIQWLCEMRRMWHKKAHHNSVCFKDRLKFFDFVC